MELRIRPLTSHDRELWQELWRRHGRKPALHWDWPAIASAATGTPVRLGAFHGEGGLAGGVAFIERRRPPFTFWRHPLPLPFGGVLFDPEAGSESFFRDFLSAVAKSIPGRVAETEILLPPGFDDVRGALWEGWTASPHYNYVNEWKTPDDLLDRAEGSVRRQIKKAEKEGLKSFEGRDLFPAVMALWEKTRRRQQIAEAVSPEIFQELLNRAAGEAAFLDAAVLGVGTGRDDLQAGAILAAGEERSYYLLGASAGQKHGSGAPSLLHLAAARLVEERDWPRVYDWVGANTPPVAQFKKKFRPELEMGLRLRFERKPLKILRALRS